MNGVSGIGSGRLAPVGKPAPNAFGLPDMTGDVRGRDPAELTSQIFGFRIARGL